MGLMMLAGEGESKPTVRGNYAADDETLRGSILAGFLFDGIMILTT